MQQVNLYTEALRPVRLLVSLNQVVAGAILTVILLILLTFGLQHQQGKAQAKLASLQGQVSQLEATVVELRDRAARMVRDERLVATNAKLKARLQERTELMALIGLNLNRSQQGFSQQLVSLARQDISSLWLTRLYFDLLQDQIRIEGIAANAESVPHYLQQLRKEPAFIGHHFELFSLFQQKDSEFLAFVLASRLGTEAP
ncbi:fimbrial assembly family protein [Oleiphilus messinensis]|uniref:Fimbrial assembly family protein n=1 Tax=Oleiphilus messinensis TaxID=141451 RepID=A0A1Y0I3N9_9GAMM|nr:hypothetical protein [Oleiphilus messinensis]ARU54809.1 fimbrial assembly family protein [Oleiphilus messinensis]